MYGTCLSQNKIINIDSTKRSFHAIECRINAEDSKTILPVSIPKFSKNSFATLALVNFWLVINPEPPENITFAFGYFFIRIIDSNNLSTDPPRLIFLCSSVSIGFVAPDKINMPSTFSGIFGGEWYLLSSL